MIANYRKTIFQTTVWQGLVLIAYGVIIIVQYEDLMSLKKDNRDCFNFIVINVCLYLFGIVYNILSLIFAKYYKFFIKGAYMFQLVLVGFTIYGITLTNQMYSLQQENKQYLGMYSLFIWMLCIRFLLYMFICMFMWCLSFAVCVAVATGQTALIREHQESLESIPNGLIRFLNKRAYNYNPKNNIHQVTQCAICLENFSESDGKKLAHLNCSSKHVFHVQCIIDWCNKNSICPMCREPIRSQTN